MSQRRVVRSIGVRSVARVVFGISLSVWGIALVGLVALYILGLVSGGLGGVEGFIASLGFTDFRLSILPFIGAFVVVGVIASALAAIVAGLLAHLYNVLHPITGGVDFRTEESRRPLVRPSSSPPAPPQTQPSPPIREPETPWAPSPGE